MAQPIFRGVATALITPMHDDGSVNVERLRSLVNEQIEKGVNALVACGTTGESATLDHEEHVTVIRETVSAASGRVPVIAGTGSNDTRYAVELSKEAERLGADALLMVTPYYNKTSQDGLVAHYTYVADRVKLPIILYNVPSRTGTNIQPATYARLAGHRNIAAIKEANGDLSAALQTMSLCGDQVTLYSGNDDQTIPFFSIGGQGIISVFSNLAPDLMSQMCQKYLAGDQAGALAMQMKYLAVMNAMFCDVNPIPVKAAMNLAGMQAGPCRLPLVELSDDKKAKLADVMRKAGLLL